METLQKIFHDNEEVFSPDILKQIESVFENKRDSDRGFSYVCESKMEYGISKKSRECTLEDYYQLPDERRAELIDGVIYDMSAPTIIHQKISLEISVRLHAFISQKKGACMVFSAPVDVQLDCDEKTMVQPDVLVVCDREKIVPTHVQHPDRVGPADDSRKGRSSGRDRRVRQLHRIHRFRTGTLFPLFRRHAGFHAPPRCLCRIPERNHKWRQ